MECHLENPLTNIHDFNNGGGVVVDDETMPALFVVESDHMISATYLKSLKARDFDFSLRRETLAAILHFSFNFDPLLTYLAANYLDRFLSSQKMPQTKPWMLKLLAISCISLAAKMTKTDFHLTDFQSDGGLIFDTQTIERMEYLVLGALKWRMRSITPFSFLSFFISLFQLNEPPSKIKALKARAIEIIFEAQNDIKLLEFKPSIICASALLSASHDLFPLQFTCLKNAIFNCSHVNKENMLQCYNAIQEIAVDGYDESSGIDTVSSSDTPVNVLDRRFWSSESDKTNGSTITTTDTGPTPSPPERDTRGENSPLQVTVTIAGSPAFSDPTVLKRPLIFYS
uniref:Cyclin D6-2 n=1 Tax=Dimocarpus longan TaxID=128017 RepID=A0A8G0QYF1_9ROSI|nr:cyclin D6-2 [Dimocarpus longan]